MRLERLAAAEQIVHKYSGRHVKLDIGLGVIGSLPIPWMGTASIGTAVAAQAPLIYQPMVRKLCHLYGVAPSKRLTTVAKRSAVVGAAADLAGEFGKEFVVAHLRDAAFEYGIGLLSSSAPVIGGVIGAIVDVKIAREVTRLVGVMTLVYLENPAGWLGTKRSTYELVRSILHKERKTPISRLVKAIVEATERDVLSLSAFDTLRADYGENAGVVVDSLFVGVPLANDADNISQPVLDEVEHLRHNNPGFDGHNLHEVADALRQYHDHNWDAQFAGHVGEAVAQENMPHSTLPDSASQEAYDITDGHGTEWQVKTGATAARMARDHLDKHPDIPVITNDSAAESLQADHLHAVGMSDLDTDRLLHMVDSTTVSIKDLVDMHPSLPILATIFAIQKEVSRWRAGEISALRMVGNVTTRVSSRSASIFIVTSSLIFLASAAGTIAAAGPLIAGGAILGGLIGNEVADELVRQSAVDQILKLRVPIRIANQLVIALQPHT